MPTRFLHDCRRTAARNLVRASVPERVAMLLTGHKSRAIFDRYNIINEQEPLDAGDQLVAYLAQHAPGDAAWRAAPTRPAPPRRAPFRPSASCDAPPRKGGPPVWHTRRLRRNSASSFRVPATGGNGELETRASAGTDRRRDRHPGRVAGGSSQDCRDAGSV